MWLRGTTLGTVAVGTVLDIVADRRRGPGNLRGRVDVTAVNRSAAPEDGRVDGPFPGDGGG
jgi:hypothetical protein